MGTLFDKTLDAKFDPIKKMHYLQLEIDKLSIL